MKAKNIYEKLFEAKQTNASALEKAAKLGDKTVRRAMERDTGPPTLETAKKIQAIYPDISLTWLMTGEGEMSAKPQTTTVEIITLQRDLIEALKRSEAHAIEAKEAYKKNSEILANSIPRLAERIEEIGDTVIGLGALVSGKLAPSVGLTELQASAVIEDKTLQARLQRKGGSQSDSGKQRRQGAKTQQQA